MKILYVCRLYSGFEQSLHKQKWSPTGAPTIAKMFEAHNSSNIKIVLTQKEPNNPKFPKQIQLENFLNPITIIAGPNTLPVWLWKFRDKISEILQCLQIFYLYLTYNPDIVYCDRANIFTASLLARFTNARVIWRVMGVLDIMHQTAKEQTLRSIFLRWLWRSPFAHVICTRDGSDGEVWLKGNLHPDVPYQMLLNGIDFNLKQEEVTLPEGPKILFVGRLEPMKGAEELLHACAHVTGLQVIIVGDGSLTESLKKQALSLGMSERVHFLGTRKPAELKYIRRHCDFYVSLNTHGNLTNVNLEALSDHLPTIIPKSNHQIDKDTDMLIPSDVFYRFGTVGDTEALIEAIQYMMDPQNRIQHQQASKACANQILPTWEERVQQELAIYEEARSYDVALVIADLASGGAQKVAISLLKELAEQQQKLAVITLQDKTTDFHALPENMTRLSLSEHNKSSSLLANIGRVKSIRSALKNLNAKNVISFIGPTNILCVWACMGLKSRLIISERNDPSRQSFGKIWDTLRKLSYRYADIVSANSENAIETLKAYVPHKKLYYLPNAIAKPSEIKKEKENSILIVGRLHPQKNHKILLNAFAQIHAEHPDWELIIVGDGPLKEQLIKQAKDLSISDFVKFTGTVQDPHELYMRASIFVLPSLHEGTPNALLEAISYKCTPIISDACEGALKYIKHNKSGLICPVNNVNALAASLTELICDRQKRIKLAETAHKNIEPLFARNTADIWKNLMDEMT